ncbi:Cyclic di-GMP phosphodiesterase response regulator RpfG [uncultured Pleomorphomonas sp.]|uniref:Cyclic di-GMP phosphodiesterase response regulator RpfG n=1 Tax=uncultured Pleomorphomonas sp. TaxID=442121 RepID=A0A212LI19_9HYPH|nr:Cyclic di-GMP phosphodiesterase response regulator RpfG [uncultured Pleomorphomonas sp.]
MLTESHGLSGEPMRALIVDDSKSVLLWMGAALTELPNLSLDLCDTPEEALALAATRQYDLVVVDYLMPKLTGIELTAALRQQPDYHAIPIVMITAEQDSEVRLKAIVAGVNDFLNKPFDPIELRARVTNLISLRRTQVELAAHAHRLEEAVREATAELASREKEMIWRLARAIEMRDGGTGAHVARVAAISRLIAEGLPLAPHVCQMIHLAAPLHDIGKIGVRDAVLNKPGRLTPEEMAEIREHVNYGVRLLENGGSDLIRVAAAIIGGHHEKWDGSGYPRGLAGTAIPIEARVTAVADVFDALTSARPYKEAWPAKRAYDEIVRCSGSHFDPDCVRVFCEKWPDIEEIARTLRDDEDGPPAWPS